MADQVLNRLQQNKEFSAETIKEFKIVSTINK